jgi:hypothetical protein
MILNATAEQRSACAHAADLVAHQAEGLRLTGSKVTTATLETYVATLRKIASAPSVELSEQERTDIEQASFVLEGIRDGLLTAEFRDRANLVNQDIHTLNSLVAAYNASPMR